MTARSSLLLTSLAVGIALSSVGTAVGGTASSPARAILARETARGSIWVSGSARMPAGSELTVAATYVAAGPWTTDGCVLFSGATDGSMITQSDMRVALPNAHYTSEPRGEYMSTVVRHPKLPNGKLTLIATGEDRPSGVRAMHKRNCIFTISSPDSSSIVEFMFYIGSRERLKRTSIAFIGERGIKITRHARGYGVRFNREWDIMPTLYHRSGQDESAANQTFAADALVMAGGTKSLCFRRGAAVHFATGWGHPPPPVWAGPDASYAPALLSVTGPTNATGAAVDGTALAISSVEFIGESGRYDFNVEALVSPALFWGREGAITFGKLPFVVLATADVNLPARRPLNTC